MKKLFLTSGIIACMACPALATDPTFTSAQDVVSGACQYDPLLTYSGSTTLNAVWTADPYKIIYKAGTTGGTHDFDQESQNVANPTANVTTDGLLVLTYDTVNYDGAPGNAKAANTFSIYGYHFKSYDATTAPNGGWTSDRTIYGATPTNTTATHYAPGTSLGTQYNVTANTVLTAQWEADSYTISYNCNTTDQGQGTAPASQSATYDAAFSFDNGTTGFAGNADATGCYKNGSHFTGWSCVGATSGATVNPGTITCSDHSCTYPAIARWEFAGLENGETINCTAQYEANTITLTYTDTEGNTVTAPGSCQYGSSIDLPDNPSRTGYTFQGWQVTGTVTPETGLPNTH